MNHFRYRLMNKPGGQVNFMVEEFIQQSDLPLYTPNDVIYVINADHLSAALHMIKGSKPIANCVLIVPPDKSIALTMVGTRIAAFDSHPHTAYGALTALADTQNIRGSAIT